jgi:hypothetical protein
MAVPMVASHTEGATGTLDPKKEVVETLQSLDQKTGEVDVEVGIEVDAEVERRLHSRWGMAYDRAKAMQFPQTSLVAHCSHTGIYSARMGSNGAKVVSLPWAHEVDCGAEGAQGAGEKLTDVVEEVDEMTGVVEEWMALVENRRDVHFHYVSMVHKSAELSTPKSPWIPKIGFLFPCL